MAVSLDAFYPYIAPLVPGCAQPIINDAILRSAIDFCNRSQIWSTVDSVNVTFSDFPLIIYSENGRLSRVHSVSINGVYIRPSVKRNLDFTKRGVPAFFIVDNDKLFLYPLPESTVNMRYFVTFVPSQNACEVEDFLYNNWLDTIVAGALKLLFIQANTPWFNPDNARYYTTKFEQGVHRAAVDANRGVQVNAQLHVQQVPFV